MNLPDYKDLITINIQHFLNKSETMMNVNDLRGMHVYNFVREYLTLELSLPRISGKTTVLQEFSKIFSDVSLLVNRNNYCNSISIDNGVKNCCIYTDLEKNLFKNNNYEIIFLDEIGVDKMGHINFHKKYKIVSLLTR